VLHKATDFGRILISHDRKTMPAHFARFLGVRSSPGLIIVPQELAIGGAIDDLLIIWAASDAEEWRTSSASSPYKQVRSATTRRISLLASKPKLR
jgi:hypothetical protein